MPTLEHRLDLRHVVTNVRSLSAAQAGSKDNAQYLASQVLFSAALPTSMLFHQHWLAVLVELARRKAWALSKYSQDHLLRFIDGRWTAGWLGGLGAAPPGHGPHSAQQALERRNRTLKTGLPAGYHNLSMSQVTAKLESVVRAHQIEQMWINETESEVLFQASDPTEPSPGLISSDWIRADRDEEDQQRLLAPVWRFLEYLPSNFVATEVGSRVQSFDVKRSYTMPVRQANLQIDDTCHERLFRLVQAESVEQFTEAAKQLN